MRFATGILQSYDKMPKKQTFFKQNSVVLTKKVANKRSPHISLNYKNTNPQLLTPQHATKAR